jgi:glycogen debranching enzyme
MLVRINARPDTIYLSHGRTVLATRRDGFLLEESGQGLFVHETRLLSRYRYLIDGEPPTPNVLSNVEQHSWLGYYIAPLPGMPPAPPDRGSGQIPAVSQQTLELRVSRFAGEGIHEDLDLTNFGTFPTSFELAIEIDGDFADLVETGEKRIQRGRLRRRWSAAKSVLDLDYVARHGKLQIHRGVAIRFRGARPRYRDKIIRFRLKLAPKQSWHICIDFEPRIDGTRMRPIHRCRDFFRPIPFMRKSTRFESSSKPSLASAVVGALEQARYDLAALRLFDLDTSRDAWTMAAGLPMYIALYGRDSLTASWQAGLLGPEMMRGTLNTLAKYRGRRNDDWRDEQPGRMIHEMHTGPLSALNINPRARSFSSLTTSALYPFIVAELWHWTGDKAVIKPLIEPAMAALRWLDRSADLDGDGFYEYKTRSSAQGVRNQGWKDSDDAIVDDAGRLVDPPIATCEEQGFVYISKLHFSEVLWWFGRRAEARKLFGQAEELKRRFNEAFWDKDERYFVLGLDSRKQPIRSVTSNAAHCVATAICDSDRVEAVADRLFRSDLFTGWGIRTLSSDHPSFNPYSYHRGSVWPVEHGTFALGFMRYGLHDRAQQIARAQFEAVQHFDFDRLPELFSGHARDEDHPFPAVYPNANTPQAWSASSVYSLLQAMLGLYPYAPLKMLIVDPHLPEWLPEITLRDLRVGRARTTIRFYRKKSGASTYKVLEQRGTLHVIRQPTPWSLTATFAERLRDWLTSLLPGK